MPKALKNLAIIAGMAAAIGVLAMLTLKDPHRALLIDPGLQSPEYYKAELRRAVEAHHAGFPQDPSAETFPAVIADILPSLRAATESQNVRDRAEGMGLERSLGIGAYISYDFETSVVRDWLTMQTTPPEGDWVRRSRVDEAQHLQQLREIADEILTDFERSGALPQLQRLANSRPAWVEGAPPEQPGHDIGSLTNPLRGSFRLLMLRARRAAMFGDTGEATRALILGAELIAAIDRQSESPNVVLVNVAQRAMLVDTLEDIAIVNPPTPAEARAVLNAMRHVLEHPTFPEAEIFEPQFLYWSALDRLEAGIDAPGEPGLATGPNSPKDIYRAAVKQAKETDLYERAFRDLPDDWTDEQEDNWWEARAEFRALFPNGRINDWQRLAELFRGELDDDDEYLEIMTTAAMKVAVEKMTSPYYTASTLDEFLASAPNHLRSSDTDGANGFFRYAYANAHHRLLRYTQARGAALYLAARAHEAHYGAPPATLDDLVPEYFDELPVDPLAPDGRFHYRVNQDNTFTLYAVGENQIDDGGVLPLIRGEIDRDSALSNSSGTPCGDYVLGPARFTLTPPGGLQTTAPAPPGAIECN